MNTLTLMLNATERSERRVSEELLPLLYDELRQLAAARMAGEGPGQTLQATALVHEAWLKLVGGADRTWNNRAHFFRAAAQAMRRILVDRAREKGSLKRGAGAEKISIDSLELEATPPDAKVLLVDEALQRLEIEDPESARIVTLKFFGGLTNQDVARTLGVTERTVERRWSYAKTCLLEMIQSEL
jgi:RNA polymerase sigma factor (TIGR02999 family)